jgi:hypothetical protein
VAEGVGEEGLPHADGPDDGDVVVGLQEAERGELIQQCAVEGDLRGGIPVLELRGGVEARALSPEGRGQAVASRHLVGEDEQEEVLVGHLLLAGEGEALGQSVEEPGELEAAQHGLEIGRDGVGGHAGSPSSGRSAGPSGRA